MDWGFNFVGNGGINTRGRPCQGICIFSSPTVYISNTVFRSHGHASFLYSSRYFLFFNPNKFGAWWITELSVSQAHAENRFSSCIPHATLEWESLSCSRIECILAISPVTHPLLRSITLHMRRLLRNTFHDALRNGSLKEDFLRRPHYWKPKRFGGITLIDLVSRKAVESWRDNINGLGKSLDYRLFGQILPYDFKVVKPRSNQDYLETSYDLKLLSLPYGVSHQRFRSKVRNDISLRAVQDSLDTAL